MIVNPIGSLFRGVLSLVVIGAGVYLLTRWSAELPTEVVVVDRRGPDGEAERVPLTGFGERVAAWRPGWDAVTALLAGGLALLGWSAGGRFVTPRLWLKAGEDDPRHERGGVVRRIARPDGTVLHVETYGPDDGPPVVLTHGWGADGTEWYYLKKAMSGRYRLIVWDLPGLGLSAGPRDREFGPEKFAGDLDAVLGLAGGRPAVLIGHSIGAMTMLAFAKLYPEAVGTRVAGMILTHTTPTNPARTLYPTWLTPALQKPVLEPLCWVVIGLSPVVWVMNWLSYLNGSAHWSQHSSSFAGTETRGQLDFVARYTVKAPPAVLARGVLGMFRYDATAALAGIRVPTLVVAADRDVTTVPEASRWIASGVPGAELATLTPARHMGLIERHAEYAALVGRFCATVIGAEPVPRPVGGAAAP